MNLRKFQKMGTFFEKIHEIGPFFSKIAQWSNLEKHHSLGKNSCRYFWKTLGYIWSHWLNFSKIESKQAYGMFHVILNNGIFEV